MIDKVTRLATRYLKAVAKEGIIQTLSNAYGDPQVSTRDNYEWWFFEQVHVTFTMTSKQDPSVSYTIQSAGIVQGFSGKGVSPMAIRPAVRLRNGHVYIMTAPTETRPSSSYSLRPEMVKVRNLDSVTLKGITEEGYERLYERLWKESAKASKLVKQYEREGGGSTDTRKYLQEAKVFEAKWSRGETWGAVKNVVPVKPGFTSPNGTVWDVGVVFNRAAFKKTMDRIPPYFLEPNMFKVVIRKEDGSIDPAKGYDAILTYGGRLDFITALGEAVQKFNDEVVKPWREAMGEEDYRRSRRWY